MPIRVAHQPSAASIGGPAFIGGYGTMMGQMRQRAAEGRSRYDLALLEMQRQQQARKESLLDAERQRQFQREMAETQMGARERELERRGQMETEQIELRKRLGLEAEQELEKRKIATDYIENEAGWKGIEGVPMTPVGEATRAKINAQAGRIMSDPDTSDEDKKRLVTALWRQGRDMLKGMVKREFNVDNHLAQYTREEKLPDGTTVIKITDPETGKIAVKAIPPAKPQETPEQVAAREAKEKQEKAQEKAREKEEKARQAKEAKIDAAVLAEAVRLAEEKEVPGKEGEFKPVWASRGYVSLEAAVDATRRMLRRVEKLDEPLPGEDTGSPVTRYVGRMVGQAQQLGAGRTAKEQEPSEEERARADVRRENNPKPTDRGVIERLRVLARSNHPDAVRARAQLEAWGESL